MPSSSESTNLFALFTSRFEALGLSYMVTGSVAAIVYGEPRFTHDVDLVVRVEGSRDAEALADTFPLDEFYCAPPEVIAVEAARRRRGHFNIIHHDSGFKADVYLFAKDGLHAWGMANRRRVEVQGEDVWLAPPEYVIVRKLEYFREGGAAKHVDDIRGILALTPVDDEALRARIDALGLNQIWSEVGRSS